MSKEITKYPGYEAYQEKVNIGLFNDIIAFVMATTAADTIYVQRELSDKHLWYFKSESNKGSVK